jgi:hypothetical protein
MLLSWACRRLLTLIPTLRTASWVSLNPSWRISWLRAAWSAPLEAASLYPVSLCCKDTELSTYSPAIERLKVQSINTRAKTHSEILHFRFHC